MRMPVPNGSRTNSFNLQLGDSCGAWGGSSWSLGHPGHRPSEGRDGYSYANFQRHKWIALPRYGYNQPQGTWWAYHAQPNLSQHSEHSHSWNELCNSATYYNSSTLVYSSHVGIVCNLDLIWYDLSIPRDSSRVTMNWRRQSHFCVSHFFRHTLHTRCLHATCATDPSSLKTICVSQRVQRSPARDKDLDPSTAEEKCLHELDKPCESRDRDMVITSISARFNMT